VKSRNSAAPKDSVPQTFFALCMTDDRDIKVPPGCTAGTFRSASGNLELLFREEKNIDKKRRSLTPCFRQYILTQPLNTSLIGIFQTAVLTRNGGLAATIPFAVLRQ